MSNWEVESEMQEGSKHESEREEGVEEVVKSQPIAIEVLQLKMPKLKGKKGAGPQGHL